jgi:hypothetical protein
MDFLLIEFSPFPYCVVMGRIGDQGTNTKIYWSFFVKENLKDFLEILSKKLLLILSFFLNELKKKILHKSLLNYRKVC